MSSQELVHDSPATVTPELGLWTLGDSIVGAGVGHRAGISLRTWWNEAVGKPWRKGCMRTSALASPKWEGLWKKGQGFKPDLGSPAVRDHRGASGNVTLVEMCSHLATERAGMGTLHLTVGAPELYPNPTRKERANPSWPQALWLAS